ncbi:PD-(D/E)XK nuclease family protein [Nocardioides panacisoli]|uniref:RecB family exonuclease n=1 Tax=Nocardioides panacisoli TaxID=627624 RepID=A0ABP7IQ33_9ACTN
MTTTEPALVQPADPADHAGTAVDGVAVVGALSPSRVSDFVACPLMFRFRTIDRLPEPPSPAAVRGTLVHSVLERLFDLPAPDRTPQHAATMVVPTWQQLVAAEPGLESMFTQGGTEITAWLASCREVLARYFSLEDPRLLEPADRELYVETITDTKLLLRGVIDRVDVAPDGAIRVVDYKTGPSPAEMFEVKALFQLKFYALVIWRTRGVIPAMLQLIYLGNSEVLRYAPDEQDLLATERKVQAVWEAVRLARETGDWQPNPGFACKFCSHQRLCPAYGGTPPPLPDRDQRSTTGPGPSAPSG